MSPSYLPPTTVMHIVYNFKRRLQKAYPKFSVKILKRKNSSVPHLLVFEDRSLKEQLVVFCSFSSLTNALIFDPYMKNLTTLTYVNPFVTCTVYRDGSGTQDFVIHHGSTNKLF